MRQLTVTPPGRLTWEDVPDPPPPAGPRVVVLPVEVACGTGPTCRPEAFGAGAAQHVVVR